MKKMLSSLAATAALLALPLAAHALTYEFNASLSGANQVPANAATGTGVATLFYNDHGTVLTSDDTFSFALSAFGLTGTALAAHIHAPGAAGTNGPVLVPLDSAPFSIFNDGGVVLIGGSNVAAPSDTFLGQLRGGLAYVNIHTREFPNGEIRGQLIQVAVVPEPATYAMLGSGLLLMLAMARRRLGAAATAAAARSAH